MRYRAEFRHKLSPVHGTAPNTSQPAASAEVRGTHLLSGIASALSAADVLGKIVFNDGMDVLSFATARGLLTTLFFWFWLRHAGLARSSSLQPE